MEDEPRIWTQEEWDACEATLHAALDKCMAEIRKALLEPNPLIADILRRQSSDRES